MSQSSPVWQVFAKAGNQVKCGICHHKLSLQKDGSTSNMKKHIERRHNAKFNELYPPNSHSDGTTKQSSSGTASTSTSSSSQCQMMLKDSFSKKTPLSRDSPRAESLTDAVLKMICIDLQPFSFTEDNGFRLLMSRAESRYVIPCRATFRNKILPEKYHQILGCLRLEIAEQMNTNGTICVTTDAWTSSNVTSYIAYTLHFIRPDFSMAAYNIGTFEYSFDHTAVNLRSHLYRALTYCGVLQLTQDSGDETNTQTDDDHQAEVQADEEQDGAVGDSVGKCQLLKLLGLVYDHCDCTGWSITTLLSMMGVFL